METVNFKINLTGTGWDDEYPECIVYINDDVQWRGYVSDTCVEFDAELEEDTQHSICVQYINRDSLRDVKRDSDGNITQNKGINIDSISIDDIALEHYNIVFSQGTTFCCTKPTLCTFRSQEESGGSMSLIWNVSLKA